MPSALTKKSPLTVTPWPHQHSWQLGETAALAVFALIVTSFTGATYARNIIWRDEVSLFQDVAEKSPFKARAHVGLANANESSDMTIARYESSLMLNPDDAEAHNNLGIAYDKRGMTEKALEHFNAALRLQPYRAEIYNNLGNAYDVLGLRDKAIECYESAIKIQPDYAQAYFNLGVLYEHSGLPDKAIEQYQRAVKLWPLFTFAQQRLTLLSARHPHQKTP